VFPEVFDVVFPTSLIDLDPDSVVKPDMRKEGALCGVGDNFTCVSLLILLGVPLLTALPKFFTDGAATDARAKNATRNQYNQ